MASPVPPRPTGSAPDGGFLTFVQCACFVPNLPNPSCEKAGKQICGDCRLVKYCSKECQRIHWPLHKAFCQSPLTKETWLPKYVDENRCPDWLDDDKMSYWTNSSWGHLPAFDSLKLGVNEGDDWNKDLDLCFVDSGDLRNVILSINGLPSSFCGKCRIVLSDAAGISCIRNTLLLLAFASFPPEEAAEIAIHLWYSASLPGGLSKPLKDALFSKLYPKVFKNVQECAARPDFINTTFTGVFELGASAEMRSILTWPQWSYIRVMLADKTPHEEAMKKRREKVMDKTRIDYREKEIHSLKPYHRIAKTKFYEDGLVLPFGAHRRHFTDFNFTFLSPRGVGWIPTDNSDPLLGWNLKSVLRSGRENSVPSNDLYGALYFYLRKEFVQFAKKLATINIQFTMINCRDFNLLPRTLANQPTAGREFDRIDVTAITCQDISILDWVLRVFGRLLKPLEINKHATLITYGSNYDEYINRSAKQTKKENTAQMNSTNDIARRIYLDPEPTRSRNMTYDPYFFRLDEIKLYLLRDWELMFKRYGKDIELKALGEHCGVERKVGNTLVKGFPFMVDKRSSLGMISKQVMLMSIGRRWGSECYFEWQRPRVTPGQKN